MSVGAEIQSLSELRSEVEMKRRHLELMAKAGIAFYEPHEKQDLFHQAGASRRRYVRTGNRWGKSTAGAAEDIAWALGYRPWYMRSFPVKDAQGKIVRWHNPERDAWMISDGIPQHSIKGLIIVADWDKAEEIFTSMDNGQSRGKLFKLLPEGSYEISKNQSGKIDKILVNSKWGGQSAIHLDTVKSFKSNPMGHESSDWDFVHLDEPCPEEMWQAHARGLVDRGGKAWFMCTPLTEMWMNDYFFPAGNIRDALPKGAVVSEKDSKWTMTGSMHDNPTLSEEAKNDFIGTLSDEDRETRIDGRPRQLTGVVYREFRPEIHIYRHLPPKWLDHGDPPRDYTVRIAADTHPKNPHAVLFCATAPSGRPYFWSEIYEQCLIPELCNRIHERLDGRWPLRFLLELAAFNDIPTDGITIADIFINAGFPVEPAVKDLQFGIMRVKSELSSRMTNVEGLPGFLQFSPLLTETIREFDRYVWDPDKGKPIDRDDHMMENLYRLVLTGLEYVAPTAYAAPKLKWLDVSAVNREMPSISLALPGQPSPRRINVRSRHPSEAPRPHDESEEQMLHRLLASRN